MAENGFISEIDSARFGIKIGIINSFNEGIKGQINKLKQDGVKMIISRINSSDIDLLNELEELNFRIKDTQLTLIHDLKNTDSLFEEFSDRNNVMITQATNEDVNAVGEISYASFCNYGHYAADHRLDISKSNEIYRDWAQRSCLDKNVADHMFVAKVKGQAAGFLSLKITNERNQKYGIQHLGAVDQRFRNYGIFRMLIVGCLSIGIEEKQYWQQTFTLSSNIPVIRSYQKLGFKVGDSNHTLHCWL